MKQIKNILIIGKNGKEKAKLANTLLNKNNNFEEVFSERKDGHYQIEETVVDGITYRIIDLIGAMDEVSGFEETQIRRELNKLVDQLKPGINQFLVLNDQKTESGSKTKEQIFRKLFIDENDEDTVNNDYTTFVSNNFVDSKEGSLQITLNSEDQIKSHRLLWQHLANFKNNNYFSKKLEKLLKTEINLKDLTLSQLWELKNQELTITSSGSEIVQSKPVADIMLENWDKIRIKESWYSPNDESGLIEKMFDFGSIGSNYKTSLSGYEFNLPFKILIKLQEIERERKERLQEQYEPLTFPVYKFNDIATYSYKNGYKNDKERSYDWEEKPVLEMDSQSKILVKAKEGKVEAIKEEIVERFEKAQIIDRDGNLASMAVLEFLKSSLPQDRVLNFVYKPGIIGGQELTRTKINSDLKVLVWKEVPEKLEKVKKARNILLIGRTGVGKSSLANLLTDNENLFEIGAGSVSVTKDYQTELFEDKKAAITYRVIDTIGLGDTKLNEEEVLSKLGKITEHLENGFHQVLFVTSGRFTEEELAAFESLEVVFGDEVVNNCTIVRNKFPKFRDPIQGKEDVEGLIDEDGKIREVLERSVEKSFISIILH